MWIQLTLFLSWSWIIKIFNYTIILLFGQHNLSICNYLLMVLRISLRLTFFLNWFRFIGIFGYHVILWYTCIRFNFWKFIMMCFRIKIFEIGCRLYIFCLIDPFFNFNRLSWHFGFIVLNADYLPACTKVYFVPFVVNTTIF